MDVLLRKCSSYNHVLERVLKCSDRNYSQLSIIIVQYLPAIVLFRAEKSHSVK